MELERDAAMEGLVTGQIPAADPSLAAWWSDPEFRAEAEELLGLQAALDEAADTRHEAPDADFDPARDTPGSVALAARLAHTAAADGSAPGPHLLDTRFTPWQRITLAAAALLIVFAGLKWFPAEDRPDPGPLMGDRLAVAAQADWAPGDPVQWSFVEGFVGEFVVEILDLDGNVVDEHRDLSASPWTPPVDRAREWPEPRFQVRVSQYDASGAHQGTAAGWYERRSEE